MTARRSGDDTAPAGARPAAESVGLDERNRDELQQRVDGATLGQSQVRGALDRAAARPVGDDTAETLVAWMGTVLGRVQTAGDVLYAAARGGLPGGAATLTDAIRGWEAVRGPAAAVDPPSRAGDETAPPAHDLAPLLSRAKGDRWDVEGGTVRLGREEWGTVIDGLVELRASAARRKAGNVESTSDLRVELIDRLIARLSNGAAAGPRAGDTP